MGTGVDYGSGVVSGYLGQAGPYNAYNTYGGHLIGKREADSEAVSEADSDADAYTIGQVYAGLPLAEAIATGHAHNPGYIAYTSSSAYPTIGYNAYNGYNGYNGYSGYNGYNGYSGYNNHLIGKREADSDADAYTIGQVYAGLPLADAFATGHPHIPGYVAYTELPSAGYNGYNGYNGFNGYRGYNGLAGYT